MNLHVTKVTRGQQVILYGRLVRSVRKKGRRNPTQQTVLTLGRLSPDDVQRWRTALQAMREGRPLIIPGQATEGSQDVLAPTANLDYLDLATLLAIWDRWELGPLLDALCPSETLELPVSRLVAALAIQRCVAPTPKYDFPDWLATTALPELMDLPLRHVNTSRIHRTLDALDQATPELMRRLPQR